MGNKWGQTRLFKAMLGPLNSTAKLNGSSSPLRYPRSTAAIIQCGNNRQAIFAAEADYQFFRYALIEALIKYGLVIQLMSG